MKSVPGPGETADITLQHLLLSFNLPIALMSLPITTAYATVADARRKILLNITRRDFTVLSPNTLRIRISGLNRTSLDNTYWFELNREAVKNKQYCTELVVQDSSFMFKLAGNKNEDPYTISCDEKRIRLDFYRNYYPEYELKSAVLLNGNCAANMFNITHTSLRISKYECGTQIMRNTTHAQYTNNVKLTYIGLKYPIGYIVVTREIKCYTKRETDRVNRITKPPASVLIPKSQVGMIYVTFSKYLDSTFTEKFNAVEYPLKLTKVKKLYFGIDLTANRKDLKAVIQNCYMIPKLNGLKQLTLKEKDRIYFVRNRCRQKGAFNLLHQSRKKLRFSYKPSSQEHLVTQGAFFKCHVTVCSVFSKSTRCKFGCRNFKHHRLLRRYIDYRFREWSYDLVQW